MKKYEKIISDIEGLTGFDVVGKEEIIDDASATEILLRHIQWIRTHGEESAQQSEDILVDKGLFCD